MQASLFPEPGGNLRGVGASDNLTVATHAGGFAWGALRRGTDRRGAVKGRKEHLWTVV